MFDIDCHICHQRYLIGPAETSSLHTTSEGPVAYVQCPKGHHLARYFHDARTEVIEEAA